jgi:exoribonuclease R
VIDLDADAEPVAVDVRRAMVRSRERFSFESVQDQYDQGATPEPFALLPLVGRALIAQEQSRGGAALETPDQEVDEVEGGYVLRYRPRSEVEDWNAQLSLLTGMAAADLMLAGEIGILRTMPAPDERAAARFRRQAKALGAPWVAEQALGDYLRSRDASDPRQLAVLHESAALFRGAGYTPFDGAVPEHVVQAAVAAEYAHVTAPLRRLVDRFGLVICEAMCRDTDVPDWVHQALPGLPEVMAASDRMARALERATLDLVEAAVLESRVGEEFDAVVVDLPEQRRGGNETNGGTRAEGTVQLRDPAVMAPCDGDLRLGAEVRVRLDTADVSSRTVRFTAVG